MIDHFHLISISEHKSKEERDRPFLQSHIVYQMSSLSSAIRSRWLRRKGDNNDRE